LLIHRENPIMQTSNIGSANLVEPIW